MHFHFSDDTYILESHGHEHDRHMYLGLSSSLVVIAFSVRACSNAVISFHTSAKQWEAGIEVILGTEENKRSLIRHFNAETDLVNVDTPDIISCSQHNEFYISWQNEVYRE